MSVMRDLTWLRCQHDATLELSQKRMAFVISPEDWTRLDYEMRQVMHLPYRCNMYEGSRVLVDYGLVPGEMFLTDDTGPRPRQIVVVPPCP